MKCLVTVPLKTEQKAFNFIRKYCPCTQEEEARESLKTMASRPRQRPRKNNNTTGNTRRDAALDAMRPFGFDEELVQKTVDELLDVYEGSQGWPFIEEASYKLLIETILGKQQISSEEKDNARREGETGTSAATLTTATSEVGSSNLVAQDSLLVASQSNDAQVSASLGNPEFDGKDSIQSTEREERRGKGIRLEPENWRKPVDDAIGSNNRNVGAKHVRLPVIQSSQPCENLPIHRRKPCYGWIGSDTEDEEDLIHLPLPPLPEELLKLLQQNAAPQSGTRRRRKSRWDEKPDDARS